PRRHPAEALVRRSGVDSGMDRIGQGGAPSGHGRGRGRGVPRGPGGRRAQRAWWIRSRLIWLASAGVGMLAFLLMLVVSRLDDEYGSHALEAFSRYQYDVALGDSLPHNGQIQDSRIILV